MTAPPIAILGAGMMTGVGLTAPALLRRHPLRASTTSPRPGSSARGGEWIIGSAVPLEQPWRGQTKLVKLLAGPVRECLDLIPGGKGRGHSRCSSASPNGTGQGGWMGSTTRCSSSCSGSSALPSTPTREIFAEGPGRRRHRACAARGSSSIGREEPHRHVIVGRRGHLPRRPDA